MEHRYNYNSYTTKPNVVVSYPTINVEQLSQKKEEKKEEKKETTTLTIEEYADLIIKAKEQERGYNYSSIEKRKLKKQVIKDIKKGKYKLKFKK